MPYIKQEKRDVLDPAIDELLRAVVNLELDDPLNNTEGNLNYVITKLLMKVYGTHDNTSYSQINSAMGVLTSCKQEFYRKVAAPYENQKAFENGEVL